MVALITINVLAEGSGYRMRNVQPFVLILTSLITLNFILALGLKVKSYFLYFLTGLSFIGAILVLTSEVWGQFYIENLISGMYFGLFLSAVIPPLFKLKPFTFEFSEKKYPANITEGQQFLTINLIINYIWAGLFALAIWLTVIHYHADDAINTIIATVVPIAVLLIIGIPVTVKLPDILMQKIGGEQLVFRTIEDLFVSMPFGLNKEVAAGVDTIIQFQLTGTEARTCYLAIADGICEYFEGDHAKPKTIIKCDSDLWLKISNNKISGEGALLNNEYEIEGDQTIMLKFAEMFAPPKKGKKLTKPKPIKYDFRSLGPNAIKNIVVFDGGFRKKSLSKTTFMVDSFMEGAKDAGAQVEYFKLKDLEIKECTGCYTCWTKTPGVCIFKDDMAMMLEKYRHADLVVFASPLYIFSVTGIMKTFMDRLLPVLKPYMITNDEGVTMHPDRYPEKGQQGLVVFSAGGFPDIAHNFDGLTAIYRSWDQHNENIHLMGEFLLPASEMIVQPVYAERLENISKICYESGKQVVTEGKIDKSHMEAVQDPTVSRDSFQTQANAFWESLDGKKSYLVEVPKIRKKEEGYESTGLP